MDKSTFPAVFVCPSLFFVVLLAASCKQSPRQTSMPETRRIDSISPEVTILADLRPNRKPEVKYLDKSEVPQTILTLKPARASVAGPFRQPAKAQQAQGNGFFTSYNTDQGLALSNVLSGYCDSQGNLWFGTGGGGLSRYNGKSFTTFTTTHGLGYNSISGIAEDMTGNLWFATPGGASRYDGRSFTTFTTKQGLPSNYINFVMKDKAGHMWFGTAAGVARYDGKTFLRYNKESGLASDTVNTIAEDKAGNLWFGTPAGATRYDGKAFTNASTGQGLPGNRVLSLKADTRGNVWIGTNRGLCCFDGKRFKTYTSGQGLASNAIHDVLEDKAGLVWIGTDSGAFRYDGKSFIRFTTAQGLPNNSVTTVTEDKEGNLWFSTPGGGVSRYEGQAVNGFSVAQGLPNNHVWSIKEDGGGNLWFGTQGAVCRFDGYSFVNFHFKDESQNGIVGANAEDHKGNLWFGTQGSGAVRFDGKSFIRYTTAQGLVNNHVSNIIEDDACNLWFVTGGGLSRFDGKSFTNYTIEQGLADMDFTASVKDNKGRLWLGGVSGNVTCYDGKAFISYRAAQDASHNAIISSTEDKAGNLWFGSFGGGVSRFDGKTFSTFTTLQGLADNTVYAIRSDKEGNLVLGTNLGLTLLKGFAPTAPAKESAVLASYNHLSNASLKEYNPVFEIYNENTGYAIKDLNNAGGNGAMCFDQNGILWAGTGDKLVRFDYKALQKSKREPKVFLQGLKINNEDIVWSNLASDKKEFGSSIVNDEATLYGHLLSDDERKEMHRKFKNIQFAGIAKWYPIPQHLILPYENNNVTFEFGARELRRANLVKYKYRLEGYDKDWSSVSTKTSASFGRIYEGAYTFQIKALSPDGIWSEPISYSFRVMPPWWRTWWMYVFYCALAIALVVGVTKWSNRRLIAQKKILEKKVAAATRIIRDEKQKSDDLLLNILPSEVAEELKATGGATAKHFNEVTVLFTDFKNFTRLSEQLSAQELLSEINYYFSAFDHIIAKHSLEKIKTIGDSYMCAGGLPVIRTTNAEDTVRAALDICDFMRDEKQKRLAEGKLFLEIRIGCHSGSVVAGIVGIKKFAYDIWGDTVNIASRMESSGEPGKVNISETTWELVKEKFTCSPRGEIEAKNKGVIRMYFVER